MYVRKKTFPAEKLVEVGTKTFALHYGDEIPDGWQSLEYPMEEDISRYKNSMRKTLREVHSVAEVKIDELMEALCEHF
jgi:hypothetical protein